MNQDRTYEQQIEDKERQRFLREQMALNPTEYLLGQDGRVYPRPHRTVQEHLSGKGFGGGGGGPYETLRNKDPEPPNSLGAMLED
jgi:hypothetical protein